MGSRSPGVSILESAVAARLVPSRFWSPWFPIFSPSRPPPDDGGGRRLGAPHLEQEVLITVPVGVHPFMTAPHEASPEHTQTHPPLLDGHHDSRSLASPAEDFERTARLK